MNRYVTSNYLSAVQDLLDLKRSFLFACEDFRRDLKPQMYGEDLAFEMGQRLAGLTFLAQDLGVSTALLRNAFGEFPLVDTDKANEALNRMVVECEKKWDEV